MKPNTLQTEYNRIQQGKGHRGMFLNECKRMFPELIPNNSTYDNAIKVLMGRGVIHENVKKETNRELDFFKIFKENLGDGAKAKSRKTHQSLIDKETQGFDFKDSENIDNLFGQQFLLGYYCEMNDPKNKNKDLDGLLKIVSKNLTKDRSYYVKNGQFGIKGLGYEVEHPGLGTPKELKGKYKSSGYGDIDKKMLRENKISTIDQYIKSEKDNTIKNKLIKIRGKFLHKKPLSPEETKLIKNLAPSLIKENIDFSDYSNNELLAYIKELSKQRASAASKRQDSLLNSLHRDIERATQELKKRSQKIKDLSRTDINEIGESKTSCSCGGHKSKLNEQMDIFDDIANSEFGMDYEQLGSNEKEWVRDEIENMREINEQIKIGDTLIKNGREGKVIKVMDDMVNVDFGNGDIYGITLRRIKGNEIVNENDKDLYQISKAGSKSNPHYVLEKPDGSKQIDMMFDTYKDAEKYASRKKWQTKKGLNEYGENEFNRSPEMYSKGKSPRDGSNDFEGVGLIVTGRTQIDNNEISDMLDETDYYGIFNIRGNYWFFPEDEETLDGLERELTEEFNERGINARFEAQFDKYDIYENKNINTKISTLIKEIGMFHDPIGFKKPEPHPNDQIYTKKFVGTSNKKGHTGYLYDIFKNGKKVKSIEGEGNANAWINNEKRKLQDKSWGNEAPDIYENKNINTKISTLIK